MAHRPESVSESRFWSTYGKVLEKHLVPAKLQHLYVRRMRHFIDAVPGVRLQSRSDEDLIAYLAKTLGSQHLENWQIAQWVDALRFLCGDPLGMEWAEEFSWEKWKDPHLHFPRDLERYAIHPRHSGSRLHRFSDAPAGLSIVAQFNGIFQRLGGELRARHYSVRTEQTYRIRSRSNNPRGGRG